MKKLNNHFSSLLILGVTAATTLAIAPVQAQEPYRGPGAEEALNNCPPKAQDLGKCDPNADVPVKISNPSEGGLQGTVNFIPLEQPGGLRLEPTGLTGPQGQPLTNIDFVPPDLGGVGSLFTVNAGTASDFIPFQGWIGTIKDLRLTGSNGEPFPNPAAPRVRDFIKIDQPPTGGGPTVTVNGIQVSGFAMDLNLVEFPEYIGRPTTTTVAIGVELQGYLLDTQGRRIEEQFDVPGVGTNVFANKVEGAFTATFPNVIDGVPLLERLTQQPALTGFGFDATLNSTPTAGLVPLDDIPEPTTILSSLLLFGGGAFQLKNRKRS